MHDDCVLQIKASDINFWTKRLDDMRLRHERKIYPPRVKMTVILKNPDHVFKLPVKVVGSSDSNLDVDLIFPLGMYMVCIQRNGALHRPMVLYNNIGSLPLSPTSSLSSGSPMDTQSFNITCAFVCCL